MSTIDERSKTTLAAAGTIVALIAGATWWLSSLSSKIAETQQRLDRAWTTAAQAEHALRTAIENPGMRVPDPRDPASVIVVHHRGTTNSPSTTGSTTGGTTGSTTGGP